MSIFSHTTETTNAHLFVVNTDMKSQSIIINVSEKYSLTVTGLYQIVGSTVYLEFSIKHEIFLLACQNFF